MIGKIKEKISDYLLSFNNRISDLTNSNEQNIKAYENLSKCYNSLKSAHLKLKQTVDETYSDSTTIFTTSNTAQGDSNAVFDNQLKEIKFNLPLSNLHDTILTKNNLGTLPSTGVVYDVYLYQNKLHVKVIGGSGGTFTPTAQNHISLFETAQVSIVNDKLHIISGGGGGYVLTALEILEKSNNTHFAIIGDKFDFKTTWLNTIVTNAQFNDKWDERFSTKKVIYHGGTGISITQGANAENQNVNFDETEITDKFIHDSNIQTTVPSGSGDVFKIYRDKNNADATIAKALQVKIASGGVSNITGKYNWGTEIISTQFTNNWSPGYIKYDLSPAQIIGRHNILDSLLGCRGKDSSIPANINTTQGVVNMLNSHTHDIGVEITINTILNGGVSRVFASFPMDTVGITNNTVGQTLNKGIYFNKRFQIAYDGDSGSGVQPTSVDVWANMYIPISGGSGAFLVIGKSNTPDSISISHFVFDINFYLIKIR